MKRITEIEVAGKTYPMNFSVKATKAICEKFSSPDDLFGSLEKLPVSEQLTEVVWIVWLLMDQGAKYVKLQDGTEIDVPPVDDLEVIFSLPDLQPLYQKIAETIYGAMVTEVEAEEIKKTIATRIIEKLVALRGTTSTDTN